MLKINKTNMITATKTNQNKQHPKTWNTMLKDRTFLSLKICRNVR